MATLTQKRQIWFETQPQVHFPNERQVSPGPQESWKDAKLDYRKYLVVVKLPEMVMARSQLCYSIKKVARGEDLDNSSNGKENGVIFVFGNNETRVRTVVQDAINLSGLNATAPIIVLSAERVKKLSAPGLRTVLAAEFRAHQNPSRIAVLLEECSPALLSDYLLCGFLDVYRAKGVQIVTICWSIKYESKIFGGRFFSEIFVPEEPLEVEPNMVVHKISDRVEQSRLGSGEEEQGQDEIYSAPVPTPEPSNAIIKEPTTTVSTANGKAPKTVFWSKKSAEKVLVIDSPQGQDEVDGEHTRRDGLCKTICGCFWVTFAFFLD